MMKLNGAHMAMPAAVARQLPADRPAGGAGTGSVGLVGAYPARADVFLRRFLAADTDQKQAPARRGSFGLRGLARILAGLRETAPPPADQLRSGRKDWGDPNRFFLTQYRSRFNPNGPSRSGNCGPASLAMALWAFGMISGDPEQMVDRVRKAMTGNTDDMDPTTRRERKRGAEALGARTRYVDNLAEIDRALAEGMMVVADGNPYVFNRALKMKRADYGNNGSYDGLHSLLVVGREGDDYIINDPMSRKGSIRLSRELVQAFLKDGGNIGGVAVAPPPRQG